jgi:hypothetical protein
MRNSCRRILGIILIFSVTATGVSAQQPDKVYRLNHVGTASEIIPYAERFQYENFKKGSVYQMVGGISEAMLNYNYLIGEVQFIGAKNDTLSIDHEKSRVKFAAIGDDLFYYQKGIGYMQVIGDYNGIKLGRKQGFVSLGSDKSIGYGQYISTGATDNYRTFTGASGGTATLDKKTEMIVTRRISLFLMDKNELIHPATKNNIVKIYAKFKREISTHLKEQEVNFTNETEVRNLLEFCRQLELDQK